MPAFDSLCEPNAILSFQPESLVCHPTEFGRPKGIDSGWKLGTNGGAHLRLEMTTTPIAGRAPGAEASANLLHLIVHHPDAKQVIDMERRPLPFAL